MNEKVYVIGTYHDCQRISPGDAIGPEALEEFDILIRNEVQSRNIRSLFEEMSTDGLRGDQISRAQRIADEVGIDHQYCDPPKSVREARGGMSDEEREAYWLELVSKCVDFPMLFVCGGDHSSRFSKKLWDSGFDSEVVFELWTPAINDPFSDVTPPLRHS